jgi:hypothetical protein
MTVAALALASMTSLPAMAHGGRYYYGHGPRVSVGFVFGSPWYYPYYPAYAYYPPAYYYPPVAYSSPPVYVERGDAYTPPDQATGYWYYCPGAQAYYPYVRQCAGGWQRVPPRPQE